MCLVSSSLPESHGDPGGGRGPVSASTQSSELSTPSSLYMEYGEYSQPQRGSCSWSGFSIGCGGLSWDEVGHWQGSLARA